eukprot:TRINITY_DN775_c0_g1_i1.p1 TRINITY_DN775_c0_g1~~TRINITY_DN775_c0_g1_i1.p1  ORF type:complete len:204 (+),score=43.95 TRINITY_DN775_c0_g1_i1:106-717(+)
MAEQKIKFTYFNMPGPRAQPTRDAFKIGGIEFEDERIAFPDWAAKKPTTPFGSVPVLTVGDVVITQSNAILRYAGVRSGLYPKDPLEAAKVDEVNDVIEDFIATKLGPTINMEDKEKQKVLREELANKTIPDLATRLTAVIEKNQGNGYVIGGKLSVADLKLYYTLGWLKSGKLDHIPTTVVDSFTTLNTIAANVHKALENIK